MESKGAIIPAIFQPRLFLLLAGCFILFAAAGTLLHECGHSAAGWLLGYRGGHISYGYTYYGKKPADSSFFRLLHACNIARKQNLPFSQQAEFDQIKDAYTAGRKADDLLITAAGPMQTMLTGSIGLAVLFFLRRRYRVAQALRPWQWLPVFCALFWLRQPFNLASGIMGIRFLPHTLPHAIGDETRLSTAFGLPPWTVVIISGISGISVLGLVVFRFIPAQQRLTFLAAGLAGGITGALLWLVWLGPRLLP